MEDNERTDIESASRNRPGQTAASRLPLTVSVLLLAGLIAASWTVLAPGAEAHGETKLVANVDQTDGSTTGAQYSQAFTTGSDAAGYVLNSVGLTLAVTDGTDIKARVFTTDSDGEPDTELYTLTNPVNAVVDNATYTHGPGRVISRRRHDLRSGGDRRNWHRQSTRNPAEAYGADRRGLADRHWMEHCRQELQSRHFV